MSMDERIKYKTKVISDLTAIEMAYGAPLGMMRELLMVMPEIPFRDRAGLES